MKIELNEGAAWAITVVAIAAVIICFIWAASTNAAEPYAIVSFNDPEHLAALTDSVVGVCDTVGGYYSTPDCPEDTIWFDERPHPHLAWLPSCNVNSWYDSTQVSCNWEYAPKAITCRELVCVTVTKESKPRIVNRSGILLQVGSSGQAIIFYGRVTQ